MIAQCCKTCDHYLARGELFGVCMRIGTRYEVSAGHCCPFHTGYDEPQERAAWQCVGCHHNCESTVPEGFTPCACHVHSMPVVLPNGKRIGVAKWVKVNHD